MNDLFLSLEIHVVRLYILGWFLFDPLFFFWRKCSRKFTSDSLSNLALNCKDISKISVVAICPYRVITASIDQLCTHPNAISVPAHSPFQYVRDTQRVGDLAHVALRVGSILHDRGAADDFELGNLGQVIENLVLYSLGKKTVVFARTDALEREHGNTPSRNLGE